MYSVLQLVHSVDVLLKHTQKTTKTTQNQIEHTYFLETCYIMFIMDSPFDCEFLHYSVLTFI